MSTKEPQPVAAKCDELPPEGFAIVDEGGRRILSKSKRQDRNGFKPNPNAQSSGDFAQPASAKVGPGSVVEFDHQRCRPWE
jgi:hypothetical protein